MLDLQCGDCLELLPAVPDRSIDLVLCDLPYGVTNCRWDTIIPLDQLWTQYKRVIKPNGAIVLTATHPFANALISSNPRWFKYDWIWVKAMATGFLNAKKIPLRKHEYVLVFYQKQPTYNPQFTKGAPYKTNKNKQPKRSDFVYNFKARPDYEPAANDGRRYPTSIVTFPHDRNKLHPTQKPVALMEYLVRTYTNPGETVLDNCFGSCSTGIACHNSGRSFIGMEKDPEYFEIGSTRLQRATESAQRSTSA